MNTIYEPKGRAKEYADLACNLFAGCDHRCAYCYAPGALFKAVEDFQRPAYRTGLLQALEREAAKRAGDPRHVLLCFSCDPYPHMDATARPVTRCAIQILHENNLYVSILTKGGRRSRRDFDLLGPEDRYGTTLTFYDAMDSRRWEPGAADPRDRIDALGAAKRLGVRTWVSLEPIIDLSQTLQLIETTREYVDEFRVGKFNHMTEDLRTRHPALYQRVAGIDWHYTALKVMEALEKTGVPYKIKKDLRYHLTVQPRLRRGELARV